MRNIEFRKNVKFSTFRKIAMGTWKTAKDPSVYGVLEVDMSEVQRLLPKYCEKHGVKVTPAHLVGRAVAYCMERRPEINGMIRGCKIYLRKNVTLFYQVNVPGKKDKVAGASLSGCSIHEAEKLTTYKIAQILRDKAELVRENKDKELAKNINMFKKIPWWASRFYLNLASFLIYGLNIRLGLLGLPRDPFGSVMITNIGSLDLDMAWAPLCPYTRVPLLLTVGRVCDRPIVVNGKLEVKPMMPIGVTFDHRLIDGVHASQMAKDFKRCFSHPEESLLTD